jgi:hypothetical protein
MYETMPIGRAPAASMHWVKTNKGWVQQRLPSDLPSRPSRPSSMVPPEAPKEKVAMPVPDKPIPRKNGVRSHGRAASPKPKPRTRSAPARFSAVPAPKPAPIAPPSPPPPSTRRYNMRPKIVKPKWGDLTDMVAYGKHARASAHARTSRAAKK